MAAWPMACARWLFPLPWADKQCVFVTGDEEVDPDIPILKEAKAEYAKLH
jgi:hypothetical protein